MARIGRCARATHRVVVLVEEPERALSVPAASDPMIAAFRNFAVTGAGDSEDDDKKVAAWGHAAAALSCPASHTIRKAVRLPCPRLVAVALAAAGALAVRPSCFLSAPLTAPDGGAATRWPRRSARPGALQPPEQLGNERLPSVGVWASAFRPSQGACRPARRPRPDLARLTRARTPTVAWTRRINS